MNNMSLQASSIGEWVMDSGALSHISYDAGILPNPTPSFNSFVTVGNDSIVPITHTATAQQPTPIHSFHLRNVLIAPSLVKNLISVRKFTHDNSCSIEFDPLGFYVKLPERDSSLQ